MPSERRNILITGGAGFIGSTLAEKLLQNDYAVTVIDNFDSFYPKAIKVKNISLCTDHSSFRLIEIDILDAKALDEQLTANYYAIIHLAARAGVRQSIENPIIYQDVNVKGTQNLLEFARRKGISQFIFASSSSVYGTNNNIPWKEDDCVLKPVSPYAGTKISAELLGHVYSYLYNIRFLALRLFTVYGPKQRPDLAIHLFAGKIIRGEPINFFGDGNTRRDYTYIDDIVKGIFNALNYTATMYEVFNLGNHQTVSLSEMLQTLEQVFQKKAVINKMHEQMGDVPVTYADISKANKLLNYLPETGFRQGVENFRDWFGKQYLP